MELSNEKIILIFGFVYVAMVANAFWEAYVEGRNPWDQRKLGWKLKLGNNYTLPAYHFWLFVVMWPAMLMLPMVITGWNWRLAGILTSAYLSGAVLEDFLWYVVNPEVKLSEFGPKFVTYHPWAKIGKLDLPISYVVLLGVSILVWYVGWK